MFWSAVCRWTRSWCLTSVSRSGREPPAAGASSRSRQKCCAPAATLAVVCPRGASCVSDPAHFGVEWCWAAARAILTLSCSWSEAALKRLSLLRFAAEEVPARSYSMARPLVSFLGARKDSGALEKKTTGGGGGGVWGGGVGVGVGVEVWWWWWCGHCADDMSLSVHHRDECIELGCQVTWE